MPGETLGRLGNPRKERIMTNNVFSEFEITEQHIKFKGEEAFSDMNCVGSCEEELEVKVITKKCRGVVRKEKVKGTGKGSLKESLHIPYKTYLTMFGMKRAGLADGVYAYGEGSKHPEFALTQRVIDEDDEVKLKAYPRCIIETAPTAKIENGAEEVAEVEITITLLPDDDGMCVYEALEEGLDETIKSKWLKEFTSTLVAAS